MSQIETPFVDVSDAQVAFGVIPNMTGAIVACPQSFKKGDCTKGYNLLANDLFAHHAGWRSMTDDQISEMKAVTDESRYTDEKWRYIQCWLKSRAPRHEDKEAVVAWCLSLILKEPPPYTLP